MPRKRRVQYPGAIYHIISRGNYRKPIFQDSKTAISFESTLLQAAKRCHWEIYAYVVMINHFHLCVHTPKANLVEGMKWLLGTFATRFNRFHHEQGHVFQGRYKAILVEEDSYLRKLLNYIHLNPVRAGICTVAGLWNYSPASYSKLGKENCPKSLRLDVVSSLFEFTNSPEGLAHYTRVLENSEARLSSHQAELRKEYCSGWFLGSEERRIELQMQLNEEFPDAIWEGSDLAELEKQRWASLLSKEMVRLDKNKKDILDDPKGAKWKVAIAKQLRENSAASNPWISHQLNMGHPSRISQFVKS